MEITISQHGRISPTTQVITRVLTGLGLRHRTSKRAGITQFRDFAVRKMTNRYGETEYTYVVFYTRKGEELAAANADQIEKATRELGYPFKVTARAINGRAFASVMNG